MSPMVLWGWNSIDPSVLIMLLLLLLLVLLVLLNVVRVVTLVVSLGLDLVSAAVVGGSSATGVVDSVVDSEPDIIV